MSYRPPALTSKSTANSSSASLRNAPSRLHFSKKQAARTSATPDHAHSKHANSRHEKTLKTIQVCAASILKKCRPQGGDIFCSPDWKLSKDARTCSRSRAARSPYPDRHLPTPTKTPKSSRTSIELFHPIGSRMPQKNRCDYPRTLRNSGGVKNLRLR